MGLAMKNLEYLSQRGYLSKTDCAVLDIGSQNLYHATPEAIRSFVERHGTISDEKAFEEEAKRISYFSWPRPGERTSYVSELFDLTSIQYTSYDVCPALKTEIFDLNCERLPEKYHEYFDLILNFGTTEHIINQLNSFRLMHEALKAGGVFFHQLPSVGWIDHGYFCYHECFFRDLIKANHYETLDHWYTLAGQAVLEGKDFRDPQTPEMQYSGQVSSSFLTLPSFNVNFIIRKKVSRPFAVGLELATSHSAISSEVAQLYENGGRAFPAEETEAEAGESDLQRHCFLSEAPAADLAKALIQRIAREWGFAKLK